MHLRVEYETVRRLPGPSRDVSRWILFTVRTHVDPIGAFDADVARALRAAMEKTSPEELEYKSLGDAKLRDVVDAFLKTKSGRRRRRRRRRGDGHRRERRRRRRWRPTVGGGREEKNGVGVSGSGRRPLRIRRRPLRIRRRPPTASGIRRRPLRIRRRIRRRPARDEHTSAASKNNVVAGPTRSISLADPSPSSSDPSPSSSDPSPSSSDRRESPPRRIRLRLRLRPRPLLPSPWVLRRSKPDARRRRPPSGSNPGRRPRGASPRRPPLRVRGTSTRSASLRRRRSACFRADGKPSVASTSRPRPDRISSERFPG